ncbi:MAG: hypothetical protein R2852_07430 [Bacteroidia bacterium]
MKIRSSTLFLFLLCSISLLGQVKTELTRILRANNFIQFEHYTDSLLKCEDRIDFQMVINRDLAPGFKELIFRFYARDSSSNKKTYWVTLLASKTQIAYYEINELNMIEQKDKRKRNLTSLIEHKDKILYSKFIDSFKRIFGVKPKESELFREQGIELGGCGYAGKVSKNQKRFNRWIRHKKKNKVLRYLKSPNSERQVSAIRGLYMMQKMGKNLRLSQKELQMINYVKNKSGTIFFCSGCTFGREEIKESTKSYKF